MRKIPVVFLALLFGCNLRALSPEDRTHISSLGPVTQKQEQNGIKLEGQLKALDDLNANVQTSIKGLDTLNNQLSANVETALTAVTELKTVTEQQAGRDANSLSQSGFNVIFDHGSGLPTIAAIIAALLGWWKFYLSHKVISSTVKGVEAGTEKFKYGLDMLRSAIKGIKEKTDSTEAVDAIDALCKDLGISGNEVKEAIQDIATSHGTEQKLHAYAAKMVPRTYRKS